MKGNAHLFPIEALAAFEEQHEAVSLAQEEVVERGYVHFGDWDYLLRLNSMRSALKLQILRGRETKWLEASNGHFNLLVAV